MENDDTPTSKVISRTAKPRHSEKCKMNHKKRGLKKGQRKVLIIGDSHARGCVTELQHLLKKDFGVLGFITPGLGIKHIRHIHGEIMTFIEGRCCGTLGGIQ